MVTLLPKGANGVLPLIFGWRGAFYTTIVIGGPFDNFRQTSATFGVCVRAENVPVGPARPNVQLAIHDFQVPTDDVAVHEALRRTLAAAIRGEQVYVGCMGGWGRTGLFLALLAKAAGEEDPVGYVRAYYSHRAVETADQKKYVAAFDVKKLRRWLFRYAWSRRLPFLGWLDR